MKYVVTSSKIRTVINFYAKPLKRFPEKYFRGYCRYGFRWSNYILSKFSKIIETRTLTSVSYSKLSS